MALFTVFPVAASFTGEMGGMNSDILRVFSIVFFFKYFMQS